MAWTSGRGDRSPAAGDGGDDAQLVAGLHGRLELLEVVDVLVVEEHVDEAVELRRALEQAGLNTGGLGLEAVQDVGDRAAVGFDHVGAVGEVTQGGGDADANAHECLPAFSGLTNGSCAPPAACAGRTRRLRGAAR